MNATDSPWKDIPLRLSKSMKIVAFIQKCVNSLLIKERYLPYFPETGDFVGIPFLSNLILLFALYD